MKKYNQAPTMKDVAKEAGVSLGTVSKVINGISVGDTYRIKVEDAIEKLNYQINNYARGLKSNKTYNIVVIVPNILNPFFAQLVHYINRELNKQNYRMILCDTDYNYKREQDYLLMALQNKVDGIICLSYNPDLKVSPSIPFVSIDRYFGTSIPCVAADNYAGGRLAAEKLYENGCRSLAFFRVGSNLTNEPNKRKDGFIHACEELGVSYTLKIMDDDTPFPAFESYLHENCENGKLKFDGIFCVTDRLAHEVLKYLRSMNLRVPEDVQVIGFDGLHLLGDSDLVCSTLVQPIETIASTCVNLVVSDDLTTAPTLTCLPVTYTYGGTTRS